MKKVKLLGVLATSAMLLAGCVNGGGETTSTAPTTSDEPTTSEEVASEWSEADAAVIKDLLSYKSSGGSYRWSGKLPHDFNASLKAYPEEDNDETYLFALGDKVTEAQLEKYANALESNKFGFVEMEEVPEDITYFEDFEDDTVRAYWYSISGDYFFPSVGCAVVFGQQLDTLKFQLCATLTICGWDKNMIYGTNYRYYPYQDYKQYFDQYVSEYATGYILNVNGYPDITEDMSDDEYESVVAEAGQNYVFVEDSASSTAWSMRDPQYCYPFSYGNAYNDDLFEASEYYFYGGMDADEFDALLTAVTGKGYVQGTGDDDWIYTLTTAEKGKFIMGLVFYDAGEFLESETVVELYYNYEAPAAA